MSAITCLIISGVVASAETQNICVIDNFSATSQETSYLAQIPEPIPPRSPEPLPRELPETNPIPLQPNPNPTNPSNSISPIPGTITIERFQFLDHTAFSTEELTQATQHLLGKPLSFTELLQVETIITKLYTEAGYVNSGAYVASGQKFSPDGAVVEIQVVEGGLESLEITGTNQLREGYIRDRLPSAKEFPLNQNKLLEDLQLLQLNPLISRISAQLAAGSRPEASSLTINVTEADTFSIRAFIDNGRSPSVGSFRRGVTLQENNLLGFGDRLSLTYTNTDGSNVGDINYNFPISRQNGSVSLAAGVNDTEIVESPFSELDIVGDSSYFDFSVRQPIIFKPTQELALGVTFSYQHSQTKLQGDNFPFLPNRDREGETTISAIRFVQEFTQRNPTALFALRSQLSVGLDAFDATIDDTGADSRFVAWRGQAQYLKLLAPNTLFILRGDVQLADEQLLSQERFSLGGLGSVRGYRQDFLLTDSGIFASAEVQLPLLNFAQNEGVLHLIPFVDFGTAWNVDSETELDPETLAAVGIGLKLSINDQLNARIDWGIPLVDDNSDSDTLQESGIYFSLDYKL